MLQILQATRLRIRYYLGRELIMSIPARAKRVLIQKSDLDKLNIIVFGV